MLCGLLLLVFNYLPFKGKDRKAESFYSIFGGDLLLMASSIDILQWQWSKSSSEGWVPESPSWGLPLLLGDLVWSKDAGQGDQMRRSLHGEALGLLHHNSCKVRCGVEKGSKGWHLCSLSFYKMVFYVFLINCCVLLIELNLWALTETLV